MLCEQSVQPLCHSIGRHDSGSVGGHAEEGRPHCQVSSRTQGQLWAVHIEWQAQQIYITSGLQLGRAEVLRGLRNFLNTDKPEHHSIDRLKERGVEKGSVRHSTLQGRQQSAFNQANIGTVSRATLGRLLRDGAERIWAFPSATMPS